MNPQEKEIYSGFYSEFKDEKAKKRSFIQKIDYGSSTGEIYS